MWKKKNGNSNNGDRENHRTTPLSSVVSDCVKQWFQEAKGGDFSSEFVGGIADAIDVRYGDVAQVDLWSIRRVTKSPIPSAM
ncbi:unnamed protein product [Camellia sinensis]